MSNKLHIIKCLNCIYARRIKESEPCLYCPHGEHISGFRYPHSSKFVQRPGMHVRTTNGARRW